MQEVERAVERVIEAIHENYGEQLTIDDLARTAMYSKFHFTRIFQRVTGLTPGRFLSAVRLEKAKQLLTSTSLSVTDISHMVGYTSVGTFSSRFGHSVGVPPSIYRQLGGFRPMKTMQQRRNLAETRSTVRGNISFSNSDRADPVFVGLFQDRIPQGRPARCTILHRPGPYVLEDVPPGTWYVMACADDRQVAAATVETSPANGRGQFSATQDRLSPGRVQLRTGPCALTNGYARLPKGRALSVGYHGPITVKPGMVWLADVHLRPMRSLDPPVLAALPDMRSETLERVASADKGSAA